MLIYLLCASVGPHPKKKVKIEKYPKKKARKKEREEKVATHLNFPQCFLPLWALPLIQA